MNVSQHFQALFGSRRGVAVAGLVLIVLLVASANIVAARFLTSRLDLTAGHLFSLSQGTRDTQAKNDEPNTLRLYHSTRLAAAVPSYRGYPLARTQLV